MLLLTTEALIRSYNDRGGMERPHFGHRPENETMSRGVFNLTLVGFKSVSLIFARSRIFLTVVAINYLKSLFCGKNIQNLQLLLALSFTEI